MWYLFGANVKLIYYLRTQKASETMQEKMEIESNPRHMDPFLQQSFIEMNAESRGRF